MSQDLLDSPTITPEIRTIPWWRAGLLCGLASIAFNYGTTLASEHIAPYIGEYVFEYIVAISFLPLCVALVRVAVWGHSQQLLLKMVGCATVAISMLMLFSVVFNVGDVPSHMLMQIFLPILITLYMGALLLAFIIWKVLGGLNKHLLLTGRR